MDLLWTFKNPGSVLSLSLFRQFFFLLSKSGSELEIAAGVHVMSAAHFAAYVLSRSPVFTTWAEISTH